MHRFASAAHAPCICRLAALLLASTAGCSSRPPHAAAPPADGAKLASASPAGLAPATGHPLLVDAGGGLALFFDEEAEADAMVAAWAREHGLTVVDPALAHRVLARARAGEDAQTGQACGRPLGPSFAERRWKDLLGTEERLDASVSCKESACRLEIDVEGDDAADSALPSWSAPFDPHAPWRDEFRRSLGAAAKREPEEGSGTIGGVVGGVNGPVKAKPERLEVHVSLARSFDKFGTIPAALSFPTGDGLLRACFQGEATPDFLAEVSEQGRVTRCESRDGESAETRCACKALVESASAAPAVRGKRVYVSMYHAAADVVTPSKAVVNAIVWTHVEPYENAQGEKRWRPLVDDPAITDWEGPPSDQLAACFADMTATTSDVDVEFELVFDRAGRATSATLHPTGRDAAFGPQLDCARRALLRSAAPCPSTPTPTAHGRLIVKFTPIGKPRK